MVIELSGVQFDRIHAGITSKLNDRETVRHKLHNTKFNYQLIYCICFEIKLRCLNLCHLFFVVSSKYMHIKMPYVVHTFPFVL